MKSSEVAASYSLSIVTHRTSIYVSLSHEGAKVLTTMKIIHEQEVSERDPQSLKNHKNSYVSVILVHKGRG